MPVIDTALVCTQLLYLVLSWSHLSNTFVILLHPLYSFMLTYYLVLIALYPVLLDSWLCFVLSIYAIPTCPFVPQSEINLVSPLNSILTWVTTHTRGQHFFLCHWTQSTLPSVWPRPTLLPFDWTWHLTRMYNWHKSSNGPFVGTYYFTPHAMNHRLQCSPATIWKHSALLSWLLILFKSIKSIKCLVRLFRILSRLCSRTFVG